MRPPATVGCAMARLALGNAKAHLSLRRGVLAAVSPAIAAGWKRWFSRSTPHPFQCGSESGFASAGAGLPQYARWGISPALKAFPVTCVATDLISDVVRPIPIIIM